MAPTLTAVYPTTLDQTDGELWSVSMTVNAFDRLVVAAGSEDQPVTLGYAANAGPSGGGIDWGNSPIARVNNPNFSTAYVWQGQSLSAQTFTFLLPSNGGPGKYSGLVGFQFADPAVTGWAGEANSASGFPSISLNVGDNSAIVMVVTDWNAVSGASRVYDTTTAGTFTEKAYGTVAGKYTAYIGYYPDVGAAGIKTVGLTAPSGMKWSIAVAEVTPNGPPGAAFHQPAGARRETAKHQAANW